MGAKTGFLFILFSAAVLCCYAAPIAVENSSFELPGTEKIKGWNGEGVGGTPAVDIPGWASDTAVEDSGVEDGYEPTDGSWIAFMMGGDPAVWQLTDHVLSSGETIILKVDARVTWQADTLTMTLYYDDGGTRVVAATEDVSITEAWQEFELSFAADDVPAAIGNRIGVLFANPTIDWLGIDHVRLEVVYVSPVHPEDGRNYVDWDEDLEWTVANGWNIDLYWGPEDDPNLSSQPEYKRLVDSGATTWDPGMMDSKKKYYWRVDAREPNLVDPYEDVIHKGPVWSYQTRGLAPEDMTISPAVGQAVEAGANAVFAANGVNVETWTWYKEGDPTPLSDGAEYSINGNELTILNVDMDDEGYYYCVGSNASAPGETDQTAPARLLLRRLMGSWKLDYTLADSVASEWPGATAYAGTMDDPNYAEGIDGGAIDIVTTSAPYRYVTVPDTEDVYDFYPMGITVSAWIKTTETGWGAIASKALRGETQQGWVMEHNGNTIYMTFRGGGSANVNGSVADGQWHLVAGTYDPVSGITSVYASYEDEYGINRIASAQSGVNRNFTFAEQPLRFGIETNDEDSDVNVYEGLIDEVRIYPYAMDISEIAQALFLPIYGGSVCAKPGYDDRYDLNNDCRTDIGDLAVLAGAWLSDGLFEGL